MMMSMEEHKPTIVLIACQMLYAGVTLTGRAALLQDMSSRVFVVYRQFTAFLLIAPIAFVARREAKKCSLGWRNFWLISLLAFVGVTFNQNIYFEGLYLASSSAASAFGNLVPGITFATAYAIGLEKVHLRSIRSIAKIMGTVICVGGAAAMALLKGPKLLNMEFHFHPIITITSFFNTNLLGPDEDTWLLGCFLLFASASCWSLWLILQVHVSASYPDHLSLTAWMCLFAALQSGFLALIFEPDTRVWTLNSSLQLFSVLYAGLVSAITFFAQAWCISRRGPLFSALFNPLCTVIVTIFACLFLDEQMHTGSLVGAIAVTIGLYIVLWGKAKEHEVKEETTTDLVKKQNAQVTPFCDNVDLEAPLLNKESANF